MELPKTDNKNNYRIKTNQELKGFNDLLINLDKIELVKAYSKYNFNKMILEK